MLLAHKKKICVIGDYHEKLCAQELGVVAQEAAHDKAMHEMKLVFHTTCLLCITNASACTSATRRVVAVAIRR